MFELMFLRSEVTGEGVTFKVFRVMFGGLRGP